MSWLCVCDLFAPLVSCALLVSHVFACFPASLVYELHVFMYIRARPWADGCVVGRQVDVRLYGYPWVFGPVHMPPAPAFSLVSFVFRLMSRYPIFISCFSQDLDLSIIDMYVYARDRMHVHFIVRIFESTCTRACSNLKLHHDQSIAIHFVIS
jgi:hypothetical protein